MDNHPNTVVRDLTLTEYQQRAATFAMYPRLKSHDCPTLVDVGALTYPVLGLSGETGEVCEKVKKILRDKDGKINAEDHAEIAKELGDVLWYVAAIATELKLDLGQVASGNLDKLTSRKIRNRLTGSGDNR